MQRFFVQLATYQARNYRVAQEAIDRFGQEFFNPPTLWKTPSGSFVEVAIGAPNMQKALVLRDRAFAVSQIHI